ncbi:MAG: hypothetical protein JSR46_09030, partial [Verrucomicrobia bacterium]|nr:hypothetical protein [Verrucomicrobiota bacterium]
KQPENLVGVARNEFAVVMTDASIAGTDLGGSSTSTPTFVKIGSACLEEASKTSPKAKALKQVLDNMVDCRVTNQTAGKLRDKIKNNLAALPPGEQRCLLRGGWQGHAIMYEIEKQANGKYAFRIYNEGQGIEFHDSKTVGYETKYAGCIAIADIPEKLLFRRSFLSNLQSLSTVEKGQNILVGDILPEIDGTKEKVDPNIRYFVSPQRGGSCTYRSFDAFMAHSMPEKEYKHYHFIFNMRMMDEYLPQLQSVADRPITSDDEYQDCILELGLVTRSVEDFAKRVGGMAGSVPKPMVAGAREKIVAYEAQLKKLEFQIVDYEKGRHAQGLEALSAQATSVEMGRIGSAEMFHGPAPLAGIKVSSRLVSDDIIKLLSDIEKLDQTADGSSVISEIALLSREFSSGRCTTAEFTQVCERFFKKIGSIEALKELKFPDPQKAFSTLSTIQEALTHEVLKRSKGQEEAPTE